MPQAHKVGQDQQCGDEQNWPPGLGGVSAHKLLFGPGALFANIAQALFRLTAWADKGLQKQSDHDGSKRDSKKSKNEEGRQHLMPTMAFYRMPSLLFCFF